MDRASYPVGCYQLETCSVVRKFTGILDLITSSIQIFMEFLLPHANASHTTHTLTPKTTSTPSTLPEHIRYRLWEAKRRAELGPERMEQETREEDEGLRPRSKPPKVQRRGPVDRKTISSKDSGPYRVRCVLTPWQWLRGCGAMLRHWSQLVWFRWLYMVSSRYMLINSLRKMV
jgi:hypothetical protein